MTPLAVLAAVFNAFWLGAALAAAVGLALRYLPANAATRCVIWWMVLIALIVLPVARPITTYRHQPRAATTAQGDAGLTPDRWLVEPMANETPAIVTIQEEPAARWPFAIIALWSVVFIFRMARIVQSYVYLRRMKRNSAVWSRPLPDVGRDVRLLLSRDIASPMAAGFLRPAIMVPADLIDAVMPEELDQILLHESAHLARRDDWSNLIARLLGAVLAPNPVAWWVLRQIEYEREIACDDWVVMRTGAPRAYAETLAHVTELLWQRRSIYRPQEALASGVFGRGSHVGRRIEGLLAAGRQFSSSVSLMRVLAGCFALCGLATVGSFAPRWIAFAKAPALQNVVGLGQGDPVAPLVAPMVGQQPELGSLLVAQATADGRPHSSDLRQSVTAAMPQADVDSGKLTDGQDAAPPVFEVASVKPTGGSIFSTRPDRSAGRFRWTTQLNYLIGYAYHMDFSNVSCKKGCGAIYSIEATFDPAATDDQLRLMLQSLLADRFRMRAHRVSTEVDGYALVIGKGGLKIKEANPDAEPPAMPDWVKDATPALKAESFIAATMPAAGVIAVMGRKVSMAQLAANLQRNTKMAVWDRTGLSGNYYFAFRYALDPSAELDTQAPALTTALQESLGLRLEKRKGPSEILAVDSIEEPSEN